ncbi:hypothetical protein HNQ62_002608 [Sulfurisphaera ohwakuensis]|uniref:Uncharacterized protein n=1 Tax=Sulfurisphaera ohwakuensis TaxID=69656 RepID=A0A7J9RZZ4_SULOH|nr:hypothetical protein [Sulfurisphaera ohwakuensis]
MLPTIIVRLFTFLLYLKPLVSDIILMLFIFLLIFIFIALILGTII